MLTEEQQRKKGQEATQIIYSPTAMLVNNGVAIKEYVLDAPDENGDINGLTKKTTSLLKDTVEEHKTF